MVELTFIYCHVTCLTNDLKIGKQFIQVLFLQNITNNKNV